MSFRAILLTVVLGLILASTLTTTGLGARGLRVAIKTLLERQITATLDGVTRLVEGHFQPAERLLEVLSREIVSGALPLNDPFVLGRKFARDLEFEDGIAWFSFGFSNGDFVGARRSGSSLFLNVSRAGENVSREWRLEGDGPPVELPKASLPPSYDARKRIWFQMALEGEGMVWTPPYDFASGERGITVSQTVRRPDGEVLGVLTVDFYLSDVADYLEQLTRDFRGEPLVFSIHGAILAVPKSLADSPVLERMRTMIRADLEKLEAGGWAGTRIFEIPMPHDTYFAGVRAARIPGGLECVSAIVFSRSQAFGAVDRVVWISLLTAAAALVVSLVVGFLLANRMASPLKGLAREVARVGNFQLESTPLPRSLIREVKVLSDAVERMRTGLKSFSHYVPVDLVRDLVRSGGVAALGGERRTISVMFCDLAGFTAFSEKKSPETAVETLTTYFESFGPAIEACGGVIDKFLGDGIMALFNAPEKIPDAPASACRAALRGAEDFAGRIPPSGDGPLGVRVGLHAGEVLVGNVGTATRFTYTAIGDVVNLCSRLEGLNKQYGTRILASSAIRDAAGETEFLWRHLDRVTVVGREEPLDIHELIGFRSSASSEAIARAETYSRALMAFLDRRWDEADTLLGAMEDDSAAQILRQRIAEARDGVEETGWTGVRRAREK